jgi:hypothetical protein
MNMAAILNSKSATWAAVALVGAVAAYVVIKRLGDAADRSLDEFNRGTAYASDNTGTVGSAVSALGNATNRASGGVLQSLGEWISGAFFDPNSDFDPNAKPVGAYVPRKSQVRGAL